ncbi:MAG: hypothetical protein NDI61_06430 [Bdellovibrionaceae bacterium]|nr:hypothetical protein [Pseudobdellovibrionaceae bacterium]
MSTVVSTTEKAERKLSTQMRAVLLIFSTDDFLLKAVSPFINLDTETIYWDQIQKIPFGSGHRAATTWAYGVWTDELRPRTNCFDAAFSMGPRLQAAVLQALALRWGI